MALRDPGCVMTYTHRDEVTVAWLPPGNHRGPAKEEVMVQLGQLKLQMNQFEQCWHEMHPGIAVDRWWDEDLHE